MWSRGIGTNYSIPVTSLTFSNGSAIVSGLNPREATYYSIYVPTNTTSWQVELDTNVGQSILVMRRRWVTCLILLRNNQVRVESLPVDG